MFWRTYVTGSGTKAIKPFRGINAAEGTYSNVLGGTMNTSSGNYSFVGNGQNNSTDGNYSVVVGGQNNTIEGGNESFIGGGSNNTITNNAVNAFIGSGQNNCVTARDAGIVAGCGNTITHENSFAIGVNLTSTATNTLYTNNIEVSGSVTFNTASANVLSVGGFNDVSASLAFAIDDAIHSASAAASTITLPKVEPKPFILKNLSSSSICLTSN
jgi:hypothetical protein